MKFDGETPTLWSDLGKRDVRTWIPDFERKSKVYQEELDAILVRGEEDAYEFEDDLFPFRYGSGGTLPIVRRGHEEYYCCFYRDIEPIGWNIANGGCDSLHELLNPIETIERELREELVALNIDRKEWLLFEAGEGQVSDRPEFIAVRSLMAKQFPKLDLDHFETTEIPLKWLDGPDQVRVQFAHDMTSEARGCFLNINAEDFGIEVDRIAWIAMAPEAVFFDGEAWGESIINSPVGLFEVERFNRQVGAGSRRFLPDIFFYDGQCHKAGARDIEKVVQEYFVPRMAKKRSYDVMGPFLAAAQKFDMCPVTRRIVQRYLSTLSERPTDQFDVFISFASEDQDIAQRVYDYFTKHSEKRVFFSVTTLHDGNWSRQIDQALESASRLILVGTSVKNIIKPNVEYEWRTFHHLVLRKPERRSLVPVMIGVDPRALPLRLLFCHGHFPEDLDQLDSCLPKLV